VPGDSSLTSFRPIKMMIKVAVYALVGFCFQKGAGGEVVPDPRILRRSLSKLFAEWLRNRSKVLPQNDGQLPGDPTEEDAHLVPQGNRIQMKPSQQLYGGLFSSGLPWSRSSNKVSPLMNSLGAQPEGFRLKPQASTTSLGGSASDDALSENEVSVSFDDHNHNNSPIPTQYKNNPLALAANKVS